MVGELPVLSSALKVVHELRFCCWLEKRLPPFSLLRDFSFQNTSEHFAIRFRQSYLIWEVCDVTAIELSSKE